MALAARFTRHYTDAQLEAFLHAIFIDGLSVAEAVRQAPLGGLGVPAFTLNLGYAYELRKRRRESFEAQNPAALRNAIEHELTDLAAKAVKQARALNAKDYADPAEIRETAKTLREVRSGLAKPEKPRDAPAAGDRSERPNTGSDVLACLLSVAETSPVASSVTQNGPLEAGRQGVDRVAG